MNQHSTFTCTPFLVNILLFFVTSECQNGVEIPEAFCTLNLYLKVGVAHYVFSWTKMKKYGLSVRKSWWNPPTRTWCELWSNLEFANALHNR